MIYKCLVKPKLIAFLGRVFLMQTLTISGFNGRILLHGFSNMKVVDAFSILHQWG